MADKLFSIVDPVLVGAAKRASNLSAEVGERLLSMHMTDERKAHQIAHNLAKSFFAHGDAVTRTRAKKLDLQVADADPNLERLIWAAYLGLEGYMELRTPFNALGVFLADPNGAAALAPIGPLNLPPNTPPQVAQAVWQQVMANCAVAPGVQVRYTYVNAVIESTRAASEARVTGTISAVLLPTGEVRVNVVDSGASWKAMFRAPMGEPEVRDAAS